ncbi:primosome assembly protein PriA [Acetobacter estunensis NRIC 0472]|uniref:Replication restart protein PriA n=1 Tax=Acetobacter estunensis TaxID=104097 RepID=A0A967B9P8_9PROT|nr:primosomal protein N' [Acetobacter estunensis]NHO54731.1 primosomal protein N' [Acetobacter estunensis]GBQ23259.1 primosome assembly protein PriA [Acetobacter estunensis NRIC 0472]
MVQSSLLEPIAPRKRVSVLLPLPFPAPLDYAVPEVLAGHLSPGDVVAVPLGGRRETGVVWEPTPLPADLAFPVAPEVAASRLRPIRERLDLPPLSRELRRFIDWVAAYTLAPPGMVLAMCLRSHLRSIQGSAPTAGWVRQGDLPAGLRLTPARKAVLEALSTGAEPLTTTELAEKANVGASVVRGLADAGVLRSVVIPPPPPFALPDPLHRLPVLEGAQAIAASELRGRVQERAFSVTLLEGVTGSGKTEIYLEAVAECVQMGRQALVLLPEISLSAQWMDRFTRRFGVRPAVWHSEIGQKARRLTWAACEDGTAKVVVGARSALFLPFSDLGLVIVDEEHEGTFKQEDGVTYNARDMAIVRARLAGSPVILASATPSLETLNNVETGRYRHLVLAARHGGASMPDTRVIDMRETPPPRGLFLSPVLVDGIKARLERGEQAMLFLNRRGYAPLTLCRTCGHRMECPHCTSWLVEHRRKHVLACHYCEHVEPVPQACPSCGETDSLTAIGPGIERITEEARSEFPNARILVMASDTISGPSATAEAVEKISRREVDLIIGTQIVAKGWHFPHLTLVGVVDADLGLGGADLRAGERTMQLLHQVAGRAGRAEAPGEVLLQSFSPLHPVMQALVSGDFAAFMTEEAEQRRPGFWPPFGRLAALIVSSEHADAADRAARDLGAAAPHGEGVEVLGPVPAPLAVLRGRHRRRLLLRTHRNIAVQPILRRWLAQMPLTSSVRVDVDVDPVSFM